MGSKESYIPAVKRNFHNLQLVPFDVPPMHYQSLSIVWQKAPKEMKELCQEMNNPVHLLTVCTTLDDVKAVVAALVKLRPRELVEDALSKWTERGLQVPSRSSGSSSEQNPAPPHPSPKREKTSIRRDREAIEDPVLLPARYQDRHIDDSAGLCFVKTRPTPKGYLHEKGYPTRHQNLSTVTLPGSPCPLSQDSPILRIGDLCIAKAPEDTWCAWVFVILERSKGTWTPITQYGKHPHLGDYCLYVDKDTLVPTWISWNTVLRRNQKGASG